MSTDLFDFPEGHVPRRGRLMASGIILGLLGCLFGLLSVLYLFVFGLLMSNVTATAPPGTFDGTTSPEESLKMMSGVMTMAGLFFGFLACLFLVTGVGSIFLKRWSRPFALFLSVAWLYAGCFYMVSFLMSSSGMRQAMDEGMASAGAPGPAPGAMFGIIIAVMLTINFIFGICLPALVLWLNWHGDVKVTLDFCDPKPRWTDRCPLPLLGICFGTAFIATLSLAVLFFPWFAFFGLLLEGHTARIAAVVFSAILMGLAWGIYRRSLIAWSGILIIILSIGISAIFTGMNTDHYRSMYESMGFNEEMIEQSMKNLELYMSPANVWVGTLSFVLPVIAYLIWSLRFFPAKADAPPAA